MSRIKKPSCSITTTIENHHPTLRLRSKKIITVDEDYFNQLEEVCEKAGIKLVRYGNGIKAIGAELKLKNKIINDLKIKYNVKDDDELLIKINEPINHKEPSSNIYENLKFDSEVEKILEEYNI